MDRPEVTRAFIRDLRGGDRVEAVFAVRQRTRRTYRDKPGFWLDLVLVDRTGTIPAKVWDAGEEELDLTEPGTALLVSGTFEESDRWGSSIKIAGISLAEAGSYEESDLIPGPERSVDALERDLRELIGTVQHPQLQGLLDLLLGAETRSWARFREAPAAKHYHQAYRHGLLDHTVSVAQAVSAAAACFPGIDRDVAVTGAILHDIGKTRAYNDDPLAIDLTDAGRLQGEIALGHTMVRDAMARIDGFDPRLAQSVLHIVLSHHGRLEYGSPVVPATREAVLVHAMDDLGGTLGSFDRIERELADGEAWSTFDRGIGTSAFFSSRAA
jgi:3'-5' exoribonuclease